MHTWFSLFSLGTVTSISAWQAIQAWKTAGNHRAGTLSISSEGLCITCCCHTQQKEGCEKGHSPHLGVRKIMKDDLTLFSTYVPTLPLFYNLGIDIVHMD